MYSKLDTPRASRGGARRTAVFAAIVIAVLLGALVGGTSAVQAQLAKTLTTTTAVVPGGILTIAVTTAGVAITASTPISACPTTGLSTASVTYTCSPAGSGIPAGTLITQTFSVSTGPIYETVTYNANGPVAGFPAATKSTADHLTCTTPGRTTAEPDTVVSVCFGLTTTTTVPGGTLKVSVYAGHPQSATDRQITAPPSVGACPQTSLTPGELTYSCGAGQSIPPGSLITLTVHYDSLCAGGSCVPEARPFENDNYPVPATAEIPASTTRTVTVAGPPVVPTTSQSCVVNPAACAGPTSSQSCLINPAACAGPTSSQPCGANPTAPACQSKSKVVLDCGTAMAELFTCRGITIAATQPDSQFLMVLYVNVPGDRRYGLADFKETIGTCPRTGSWIDDLPYYVLFPWEIPLIYTCQAGQSIPAGTGISVDVFFTPGLSAVVDPLVVAYYGPSLSSIVPSSGPAGTVVTLTGANLSAVSGVSFGAAAALFKCAGGTDTSCSATAPDVAAGTITEVTVTGAGAISNALTFTYR